MTTASFQSLWAFDVVDIESWNGQLDQVIEVLQQTPGFEQLTILHSPDEPARHVVQCRWVDVGSYRRGVSSTQAKLIIWPFLSTMIDAPSAFETLVIATPDDVQRFASGLESEIPKTY